MYSWWRQGSGIFQKSIDSPMRWLSKHCTYLDSSFLHQSNPEFHFSPPMPSVCPCMTPACQHILPIPDKLSASSHHTSLLAAILTYYVIKALTIRFISESSRDKGELIKG